MLYILYYIILFYIILYYINLYYYILYYIILYYIYIILYYTILWYMYVIWFQVPSFSIFWGVATISIIPELIVKQPGCLAATDQFISLYRDCPMMIQKAVYDPTKIVAMKIGWRCQHDWVLGGSSHLLSGMSHQVSTIINPYTMCGPQVLLVALCTPVTSLLLAYHSDIGCVHQRIAISWPQKAPPLCSMIIPETPTKINWLVVYLPLWKMMEFVSWDDDIPNISKVIPEGIFPIHTPWIGWWIPYESPLESPSLKSHGSSHHQPY